MKYCAKCDSRRQEDHSFCYQCSTKLIDKAKNNEEKIAMLKIVVKDAYTEVRKCAETNKQHDGKTIESGAECPNCVPIILSSFGEIGEIVLNGSGFINP